MASSRKIRRRMSVDDANADLLGHIHQTIDRLAILWDEVSMDQATREKRTESAYTLFYSTMNEIVQNEEEMVQGVSADIEQELGDVTSTRQELGMSPFPLDSYKPKSIALLKALGKDKKSLMERKMQAMARQLEEYNELVKVCRSLGESIPEVASIEERILPKSKVEEIIKQRLCCCKELETRKVKLNDLQNKLNRRSAVVKNVTLSADDADLLTLDFNSPDMVFSKHIVQRFENLLEKFESEYEKWRENIVFQYLECYSELVSLSDRCYAVELLESYPQSINLDLHDPSLLENIKIDYQKLKNRYESGKELFDKFSQWNTTFKKQDEIEGLLNTDKKIANANFERQLHELQTACEQTSDTEVTIDGLSPYQFALTLIQDREQRKENIKELKKIAKTKQLQAESRFGTTIGSPSMMSSVGYDSRIFPKSPFGKSPYAKTPQKSPRRPF